MADMTLCNSRKCPAKSCARRNVMAMEIYQSYADFYEKNGKKCKDFIPSKRGVK